MRTLTPNHRPARCPLCRAHRQFMINRGFHEPCPTQTHDARRIPRVGGTAAPALRIRWRRPRGDGRRNRPVTQTSNEISLSPWLARLRGKPCQFLRQRPQDSRSRRTTSAIPTAWSSAPRSTEPRPSFMIPSSSSKCSAQARRATTGSSKPASIRPCRPSSATSCSNRTASAPPSTPAPAMHGRTKSWSPTRFSPCLRSSVELPLAELYEGIVFEAEQDGDQPPAAELVR